MEIKKKQSADGHFQYYYLLFDDGEGMVLQQVPMIFSQTKAKQIVEAFKSTPTPVAGEYLSKQIQFYINYSFIKDDLDFLEKILLVNALPAKEIDRAIEKAIKGKKYEAQVMLMKYKEKVGAFEQQVSNEERFAL